MGQYYVPAKGSITGPWLLDLKHIEELDSIIPYIEEKLNASQTAEIEKKFSLDIKNGKYKDLEDAVQHYRKNSLFAGIERKIELTSKKGAVFKGGTLKEILIDPKLDDFNPSLLEIDISYGHTNQFKISVGRRFDGELNYKLSCFDLIIEDEINYIIKNWVAENKPKLAPRIWNKNFPLMVGFGLLLLFLGISTLFEKDTPTTSEIYKDETKALLETGINAENRDVAIELMLKYNSNFRPESIEPKISYNRTALKIIFLGGMLIFFGVLRPHTVIGVGKNLSLLRFYRFYINFVLVVIPTVFIIVPFYGYIKELFYT